ncbi:MAG TPA: PP2C family protein-serine/threonine phosphatase [Sporichthya sp.]|nr:PP2C family protein-serine/threonine phosphatase [Sporichthya sp.]
MSEVDQYNEAAATVETARMVVGLLGDTHLSTADDLPRLLAENAAAIGVESLVIYLVDYEQTDLIPVPGPHTIDRSVLSIEGTLGGRAFAQMSVQDVEADLPDRRRLWMPLLDGTERLGVLEFVVPGKPDGVEPWLLAACERYGHLAAQAVVGKSMYGDLFERVRRRQPMSVAAELQWKLLPPLVFATEGLVLAGLLEPAYDVGGDSFDYAVNGSTAHVAVFDAMGHGLGAAVAAAVAVSAYRNARRRSLDLAGTYATVDAAVAAEYGGARYSTALLARLDMNTGILSWISAGHPPPLLLRDGRSIKTLDLPASTPLGWQLTSDPPHVGSEQLQPRDRVLLYTDGLTEARTADGDFFTTERLAEFLERQSAAGLPTPETLRRLRHAVLEYQAGALQDDATALLVEWRRGTERNLVPETV